MGFETESAAGRSALLHYNSRMTDSYAVIGNPIAHSKSPQIQAAFARQTSQDIVYTTILCEIGAFAQTVQLALEYAPAPPFDAGRPETAPAHVLERFQGGRRKMMETRDEEARVAAQMMAARGHGDVVSDARAR